MKDLKKKDLIKEIILLSNKVAEQEEIISKLNNAKNVKKMSEENIIEDIVCLSEELYSRGIELDVVVSFLAISSINKKLSDSKKEEY